jgi:hypothetical protein
MVVVKAGAPAMEPVAVGFDHDARAAPEEVDLERADRDVHLRRREPVAPAEAKEKQLQVAAGPLNLLDRADRKPEHLGLPEGAASLAGR